MTLCASFRSEAGRVWKQMAESRRLGISLSEETITETALYALARRHQSGEIAIIPATKPAEAKHGADWEWWFTKNGKGVGFRVQAKRLFPSGRYESLFKPDDKLGQLKKLVGRAKAEGLIPLYCFYNFDLGSGSFRGHPNSCSHSYRGPSFWGCSLALPEDVEFANSDHAASLQSPMVPWHALVCDWSSRDMPAVALAFAERQAASRIFSPQLSMRPRLEMPTEVRAVPDYVRRLTARGRETRERTDNRSYVDHEFWSDPVVGERDIAGVVAFDDGRDT